MPWLAQDAPVYKDRRYSNRRLTGPIVAVDDTKHIFSLLYMSLARLTQPKDRDEWLGLVER